ncbi:MAG: hypothetical protein ACREIP_05305 [Alphaproteobacteria bacterium]
MLCRIIATGAIALIAASAHAGSSIEHRGPSARPNSVSYVGYDSFDAHGNPVCTSCLAKRAEEAARLQAYAERRKRSRAYMARLQGNGTPPEALVATSAAPERAGEAEAGVAQTPLRADMN